MAMPVPICTIRGCRQVMAISGVCRLHLHTLENDYDLTADPYLCIHEGCTAERLLAGWCGDHLNAVDAPETIDKSYRYAAIKDGDPTINIDAVYEIAMGLCALCGEWVDYDVPYPDPEAKTVDHIFPLVRGGTHTWDNVQLAHQGCNSTKNARVEERYGNLFCDESQSYQQNNRSTRKNVKEEPLPRAKVLVYDENMVDLW